MILAFLLFLSLKKFHSEFLIFLICVCSAVLELILLNASILELVIILSSESSILARDWSVHELLAWISMTRFA